MAITDTVGKAARVVGDVRTIWVAGLSAIVGIVMAADSRYVTKEGLSRHDIGQRIETIASEIDALQLKLNFKQATDYDKALLQMRQNQLDQLKRQLDEKK